MEARHEIIPFDQGSPIRLFMHKLGGVAPSSAGLLPQATRLSTMTRARIRARNFFI